MTAMRSEYTYCVTYILGKQYVLKCHCNFFNNSFFPYIVPNSLYVCLLAWAHGKTAKIQPT